LSAFCTALTAVLILFLPATHATHGAHATWTLPAATGSPPVGTPDPQHLLRTILDDPAIQQRAVAATPPPLPELPNIDLSFARWPLVGIGAVTTVVLIVLLGPILFRYFVMLRKRRTRADLGDGADISTSGEAIQRAQVASAAQDYRQALRMLYLASLLKLDEIGALRYDRALTNREYVRQVALKPALASALRPVVETFDDVWYGYRPITHEGYSTFEANVDGLMRAAEANGEVRTGD
jgi:hypothetical protein